MSKELKKINVFLTKEGVINLDDVIKFKTPQKDDPKKVDLKQIDNVEDGALYIGKSSQKAPEWLEFVNQLVVEEQDIEKNTTNSAVLALRVENRIFLFCFGFGRFFLNMATIERGFGLRAALNIVDSSKLRTMDYKKFDEVIIDTRRQVSQGSPLFTFDVDISSELLRKIGGIVVDEEDIANSIFGSDSAIVNMTGKVNLENIGMNCKELLKIYQRDDYKENFSWADNLIPINDDSLISELNNELSDVLNSDDPTVVQMAPPEIYDWEDHGGFRFSTQSKDSSLEEELSLQKYLGSLKDMEEIHIENLKKHKVNSMSLSLGNMKGVCSVYRCLIFETNFHNKFYVLSDSEWFHVEKEYAALLNKEINNIPVADIDLPNAPVSKEFEVDRRFKPGSVKEPYYEGYYNEFVGWKDDDKLTLDRRNLKPSNSPTRIEFCDIFTTSGQFVHVKPGTSSSKLSHLFNQGSVSAELFLEDPNLRVKVCESILKDPIFDKFNHWTDQEKEDENNKQKRLDLAALIPGVGQSVERDKYSVVYAIISDIPDNKWPDRLPFFSKVTLRSKKKYIERMGFKVFLNKINKLT